MTSPSPTAPPRDPPPTRPPPSASLPPAAENPALTTAQYLRNESDAARKALEATVARLKAVVLTGREEPASDGAGGKSLTDTAKEKAARTVGEHPWVSLGASAAAGFLAAAVAVPSREQQVLKKLAALERAAALQGQGTGVEKPGSSLAGDVIRSLGGVVKPALLHALTATLATHNTGPHDGDPPSPASSPSPTASSPPGDDNGV